MERNHRTERVFDVGDWVYLKLQPYRQNSVNLRSNLKLSPRFYGPFQITARVGQVAYKLRLPLSSKIHDVFHVSLLKKQLGNKNRLSPHLPDITAEGHFKLQPFKLLQTRIIKRNNAAAVQYLIQWERSSAEDATWEEATTIRNEFPTWIASALA